MKWQCCCRPFNVALGDVSGGPLRSCAPVYGSVRLFSVGHYPAFAELLATGIPAANYAGIKEGERILRLARVRARTTWRVLTINYDSTNRDFYFL